MDKQQLRNALSEIEDEARKVRNRTCYTKEKTDLWQALNLVTQLTQIIREEIVK